MMTTSVRSASFAAVLVVGLLGRPDSVGAQPASFSDFRSAALAALGGDVATLAISGAGWDACLGQAWDVADGWARWELTDYRRVIDYAAGTSLQTAMRRAGLDPDRVGGCGGQVNAQASRQQTSVGATASFAERLPITLTPHGVLQLAASGAPSVERSGDGWTLTVPATSGGVTYNVVADYGADYLPRRIRTWIDDPVFGDMEVEAVLGAYRSFGAIRYPASLTLNQGGMATLSLNLDDVAAGIDSPEMPAPRGPGGGGAAAPTPATISIGPGVFVMPGAYQAVAVEFADFAIVIDGMQNDMRTADVIRLTHEAIPGKPIRYIVNTHSHFDHASGLRQYAAEGATIVTHERNVAFYRAALATPRTLNPNRIEPVRVEPQVMGITDRYVISDDAGQRVDVIPLAPNQHAADFLVGYIPSIRTIVEADLLQPWINPVFAGAGPGPNPYLAYLYAELERVEPDYAQFVPIHTPPEPPTMSRAALEAAVGR